jgi:hypothetical protein
VTRITDATTAGPYGESKLASPRGEFKMHPVLNVHLANSVANEHKRAAEERRHPAPRRFFGRSRRRV